MEFTHRFIKDPGNNFFLFGPRGTGKTTWLKQTLNNAVFVDLLDPAVYRNYAAAPERLRDLAAAQKPGTAVVIDEIPKVPQLLDMVHLLIETRRDHRFVLTGSSARKLKRSGVDLLAGRAVVKTMHPLRNWRSSPRRTRCTTFAGVERIPGRDITALFLANQIGKRGRFYRLRA